MAQVSVHCELCDSEEEVRFYCVTCAEVLCKRCKEAHLRSRKTKNDDIIALSEARQQNLKSAKILLSFCSLHPSFEFNLYCSKCDELICLECLDGKHRDHKSHLQTLSTFATEEKEKLVHAKKLLMDKKSRFEKATINEEKVHNEFSECVEKCKKDILEQKSKIIKELDNICDEHFVELSVLQQKEDDRYSKSCTYIESETQAVISMLELVRSGMDTEDPSTILQATKDVTLTLKAQKESTPPQLSKPSFNPLEINNQGLSGQLGILNRGNQEKKDFRQTVYKVCKETNMSEEVYEENSQNVSKQNSTKHGKCKKSSKQQVDPEVKGLTKKSDIYMEYMHIRIVVPMENNTMWIAADDDRHLMLVKSSNGETILKSVTIDGHIADVVRYNKCLLITCDDGDKVIKMASNGKSTSVFADFSPDYWTGGLCVTHDENILVCLQSSTEPCKVVRLNEAGNVIQSIQEDHTGASLFTLPERVTSLPSGEIIVTDRCADRILCVDREGKLKFTWNEEVVTGKQKCKLDRKFLWHITHDKHNNLFIADGVSYRVFVLKKDGTGAKCLVSLDYKPLWMTVDNKGYLCYAGSYGSSDRYVVNYSISY